MNQNLFEQKRATHNRLLAKILELEPNRILEASTLERGLRYLRQKRVKRLIWKDENALSAILRLGRAHEVRLSFQEEGEILGLSCDCPGWNASGQCPHLACVLVTLKYLLAGEWRDFASSSSLWDTSLRIQLLGNRNISSKVGAEIDKGSPVTLLLVPRDEKNFSVRLKYDGKSLGPYYSEFLPKDLSFAFAKGEDQEESLLEFLGNPSWPYRLEVKTRKGSLEARWDPGAKLVGRTELDLQKGQINVRTTGVSFGQTSVQRLLRIGTGFFFDFERKALGRIQDEGGWYLAELLKERFQGNANQKYFSGKGWDQRVLRGPLYFESGSFKIPAFFFNQVVIPLRIDGTFSSVAQLVSLKNGKEVSPKFVTVRFELRFSRLLDTSKLNLQVRPFVSRQVYSFWHPVYEPVQALRCHPDRGVRRKKHRIWQAMFQMLSLESVDEKSPFIEETLQKMRFSKAFDQEETKSILENYAQFIEQEPYHQLMVSDGEWQIGVWDIKKCHKLLGLIPSIFGARALNELLKGEPAEVLSDEVYRNLSKLQRETAPLEADLYIDSRPVRSARIDFSFDATRKRDLDWFEIHPEIKIEGEAIPEEEWESVLKGSGIFEKADRIYLLHPQDLSHLDEFAEFFKHRSPPFPLRKNIVEIPRLEIFDWIALRKLGISVKLSEEEERIIQRLLDFTQIEKRDLPEKFLGALRNYQKEGYDWLAFHYEHRFGACLADDMGLGKTVQTIAFLGGVKEGKFQSPYPEAKKSHLIVLPSTLLFNWHEEIKRFYPDFHVKVYCGSNRRLEDIEGTEIVLTTYPLLRRDIEKLEKYPFHVIVFDEAQTLKNIYSAGTNAARRLKGDFKICLTGTPLENHIGEYSSIMDLCVPGLLERRGLFRKDIKKFSQDRLIQRTRPFVLRRAKEKILPELPPKTESQIYLDLTERQKRLYVEMAQKVRRAIELAYAKNTEAQAGIIAVTALLRLRQICISERMINPASTERSPKIAYLLDKLRELAAENHAAIVFSQFTHALDILEQELKSEGMVYCRMDGTTPHSKRETIVRSFQIGEGPGIFLISLRTGGIGLNLTRASYVFHLDPWWNPAVDRQASDRVHRIGQEKPVFITRLLMRHTVEEKIMSLRKTKEELFEVLMYQERWERQGATLKKSDFDFLLSD